MKKILAFLLAAVMLFAVAGCSQDGSDSKTPAGSQASGGAMPAVAKDDLKVGVIHIGEPADGAGYSYAHDQGIVAMQKELGLKDSQIIRKNNIPDTDTSKTQNAIEELVEEGCQVIFGTSFNYMNVMEQMAETYPKVIFSHCSGYKNNGKNMNNYFGRIYQARYLAGIAAGMKTQSNKIGYVAAMDVTNSEAVSYTHLDVGREFWLSAVLRRYRGGDLRHLRRGCEDRVQNGRHVRPQGGNRWGRGAHRHRRENPARAFAGGMRAGDGGFSGNTSKKYGG